MSPSPPPPRLSLPLAEGRSSTTAEAPAEAESPSGAIGDDTSLARAASLPHPAATMTKKRTVNSSERIAAYKSRVHAGIQKAAAFAELEQARKRLKEAQERDAAADSKVLNAAEELLNQGIVWKHNDTQWMNNYNDLVSYKKQYGHCSVPVKGTILGKWVSTQRSMYHSKLRGEYTTMTDARKDLLNAIQFDWGTERGKREEVWNGT